MKKTRNERANHLSPHTSVTERMPTDYKFRVRRVQYTRVRGRRDKQ